MEDRSKETGIKDEISWRQQFENNKKEIDFYKDTLDIRKNAIETYVDYNNEDVCNQDSDGSDESESDETDSCTNDDDDDETSCSITACPKCGSKIFYRNHNVENVVKLFKQMMIFRNYFKEYEN